MSAQPFFERGGEARSGRRLLLISYHFPPDTTIGARRWEKLAHFVAERGWGLDVITCIDPGAESSRLEALPHDVRIYGVPSQSIPVAERLEHAVWKVYRTLRPAPVATHPGPAAASDAASGSASTAPAPAPARAPTANERPDTVPRDEIRWRPLTTRKLLSSYWVWLDLSRERKWAERAVRLADEILRPGVHFAVVTSGPPHMTHEAGRLLSMRRGLPFVMDMRDPWSLNERIPDRWATPLWLRATARHERAMVRQAALVVANTDPARAVLAKAYPDARDRIVAVMNGSDDEPLPRSRRGGKFTIGYAGTVYDYDDPRSLFRAAARVIRERHLSPDELGMDFIGNFDQAGEMSLREAARAEGVAEYVSVGQARPHPEAMEFMAQATMLVTFPGWNSVAIPGKVFECVRFDAWLLALSNAGSATDLLLRGTGAHVVPRDDIDAIAGVIGKCYDAHCRGEQPAPIARDGRFSRRHQARILLDAIARLGPPSEATVSPVPPPPVSPSSPASPPPPDTAARTPRTSYSR